MTKNTKATIWASLAILAVIVGAGTYERQRPRRVVIDEATPITKTVATVAQQAPTATSIETSTSALATVATSTKPVLIRKPKPKAPPVPSYGDMVTKYEGFRFQFDPECRAFPNQMATKNPLTVMLDNRSNTWQNITIGTRMYGIAPYNYVIATISETTLPVNLFISCNQLKNTAQILLQK